MTYYSKNKLGLYLKMGRTLAQFIEVGEFFDDRTIDWLKLEKSGMRIRVTVVRSFDLGNEFYNDVSGFDTTNELEEDYDALTNRYFEGSLEECLKWIKEEIKKGADRFGPVEHLNDVYSRLLMEGKVGDD